MFGFFKGYGGFIGAWIFKGYGEFMAAEGVNINIQGGRRIYALVTTPHSPKFSHTNKKIIY